MNFEKKYVLNLYNSISAISEVSYNRLVDTDNPFLEYDFLYSLEQSGCVGGKTSWTPHYITLTDGPVNKLVGAITFYIRNDSNGEFIYDWEWKRVFNNSGLNYYPKLLIAIPFTPTNGTRILVDREYPFNTCADIMVNYLIEICRERNFSSIHFLFLTKVEQDFLEKHEFLSRTTYQYHWKNRGYSNFDDFLSDLKSGRRNQIKKERNHIQQSDMNIVVLEGNDINANHIDAIWRFYTNTTFRKRSELFLNRDFFRLMYEEFRHRLVLVLAEDNGVLVGGTFNVFKNRTLFGRYWGSVKHYQYLHFECCYYRLIEHAIRKNIAVFEAGAQGEHKFLRGFGACPTYSSHFINHKGAKGTISGLLEKERSYNQNAINSYNKKSPLKYLSNQTRDRKSY